MFIPMPWIKAPHFICGYSFGIAHRPRCCTAFEMGALCWFITSRSILLYHTATGMYTVTAEFIPETVSESQANLHQPTVEQV